MITYPLKFNVIAEATAGIASPWEARGEGQCPIGVSIPPEFGGPGKGNSPEDLFALALENCFVATFKVFAEKSRLEFTKLVAKGRLELDRDAEGKPWMARFNLRIQLSGVSQSENARRILERTSQNCMILNSVRTEKTFEFEITP